MGNKTPNRSGLKNFQPRADTYSDQPLARRALQITVAQDVYEILAQLPAPERIDFLRRVITEAVRQKYQARSD